MDRLAHLHGKSKQAHVEFRLNAPYRELLHWLSVSSIGISTMVEEHFGIGVVEFMVSGCSSCTILIALSRFLGRSPRA